MIGEKQRVSFQVPLYHFLSFPLKVMNIFLIYVLHDIVELTTRKNLTFWLKLSKSWNTVIELKSSSKKKHTHAEDNWVYVQCSFKTSHIDKPHQKQI